MELKQLFSTFFLLISFFNVSAFQVTLKVIDQTKGDITNKINDQNEINIYCWIDDNLKAQNYRTPDDWWYPMYNDAGITPKGFLDKTQDAWEWTITLQASPGTYSWCPGAKTLGWTEVTPAMYYYEGDSKGVNDQVKKRLDFTVNADGSLSGNYELVIPDPGTLSKFPVTLKVIDYTKGELTNAPGTWANDANIVAWVTESLNPLYNIPREGFWFYGFFDKTVNWENSGTMVDYPNGQLIKDEDKWTWQATFQAAPGMYEWNPCNILLGFASITGGNVSFQVSNTGELSGKYEVVIGGDQDGDIQVACIGDSNTAGAGVSNPITKAWPVQLRDYLTDDYGTKNLGISGATLMNFPEPWGAWENNASFVQALRNYTPDVILIALGTNDSKNGYWGQRNFKNEYITFIEKYKALESNPEIYMITPIKALNNAYGINNNNITDGIIPLICEISQEKMIPIIDWYSITSSATNADLPDGVHANDETSKRMAQKVAQLLLTPKPKIIPNGNPSTTAYAQYRWYKDGTLIEGASNASFTATEKGKYNVAVKLSDHTNDIIVSDYYELLTDNTKLVVSDETINSIPDSNSDNIILSNNSNTIFVKNATGVFLLLYNMSGNLIKTIELSSKDEQINISDLPAGVYVCKIKDTIGKIIK